MSEQEYNGLTLEGLAQRLEALERAEAQRIEAQERGEAGTGQTGDEPAYESYGPESRGKLEQAQRLRALKREELTQRLEVLERENASLRDEVASLRGSGTGILGTLLRVLTMLNRREAISRAGGYDLELNSLLITGHSNQRNVFAQADRPAGFGIRGAAVTALGDYGGVVPSDPDAFDPLGALGYGVWAQGGVGVYAEGRVTRGEELGFDPRRDNMGVKAHGRIGVYGEGRDRWPGDTADDPPPPRDTTGVKGLGDTGVWGEGSKEAETAGVRGLGKTGVWGSSSAVGRSGVYGQHTGTAGYGVVGDGKGTGILGRTGAAGSGVVGEGRGSGHAGVLGRNNFGYGGQFEGGKAQLKLLPKEAAVGKPTTGEHTKGEIYMDSEATLFVCTDDGTPGSWKRFTTTPAP